MHAEAGTNQMMVEDKDRKAKKPKSQNMNACGIDMCRPVAMLLLNR